MVPSVEILVSVSVDGLGISKGELPSFARRGLADDRFDTRRRLGVLVEHADLQLISVMGKWSFNRC